MEKKQSKQQATSMQYESVALASLFVGRWQPFHEGHKRLVETVLKDGKPVVIAIRDTAVNEDNPYTTDERADVIRHELKEYGELVKIVAVPDIDEICYGRDVGYAVRQIILDEDTEAISGTKIRRDGEPAHDVIWITGQTGAGKTTLATGLAPLIGGVILDGDEMRESISLGASYSKNDRDAHNLRVARLASVLAKRTPVVVAVIAPFEETRQKIDKLISPVWVHVDRDLPVSEKKPYESPVTPDIVISVSDNTDPKVNVERLYSFLKNRYISH